MPDDKPVKLATIECAICGAWIEVYRRYTADEAIIGWDIRDAELCQYPPLHSCQQARIEVGRRFPVEGC
jgi:hypothetical protein